MEVLQNPEAGNHLDEVYTAWGAESGEHDCNAALMSCIPKKEAGELPDGSKWYTPEATRPVSIVNTDNRILASAMKIKWENILSPMISQRQKGFLKNRSMLSSIVHIEHEAMKKSR